jgi:cytochrome P450
MHDAVVGGCLVQAGTTTMLNMWGIEHDPMVYPEPFVFPPERFKEDVSVLGGDLQLAPFLVRGSRRHMCPSKMRPHHRSPMACAAAAYRVGAGI